MKLHSDPRGNSVSSWASLGALCFIVSLGIYCLGVTKALLCPIESEEPVLAYAAQALHARGTYDIHWGRTQASANAPTPQTVRRFDRHPPTYIFLISKIGRCFGDYVFGARILSLSCVLLATGLLLVQAYLVFGDSSQRGFWTWMAGAVYLASPVTIKSSAVLDSDASLFTLSLAFFTVSFFLFLRKGSIVRAVLLGMAWLFCLFAKLTMAILIPPVLAVFFALHYRKFSGTRIVWGFGALVAAFGAYKILLSLMNFPIRPLFSYMAHEFFRYTAGPWVFPALKRILLATSYTLFWMGPVLIGMFFLALRKKVLDYRQRNSELLSDFSCVATILFVFGHVVVGGTYNCFPRFMTPGLPGLCLVAVWAFAGMAGLSQRRPNRSLWVALLVGCALWYWLGVGDYLYTVVFVPRAILRGLLDDGLLDCAMMGAFQMVCYSLPFLAWGGWMYWNKRPVMKVYFLPIFLASYFGMDVAQARARYDTYYYYGQSGFEEALTRVRLLPADRAVMAAHPFVYYRADACSIYHLERDWYDDKFFLGIVQNPKTQAVVFSLMDFPVGRAEELESPRLESAFSSQGYYKERIGSYILWIRRDREERS